MQMHQGIDNAPLAFFSSVGAPRHAFGPGS